MKFTFPPESRPLAGFTLKRAIYRGGFGEVYYALSDAGREVALKLLQHNIDVELRGVQQCLNLSHPHLVTIFDVRRDKDGDHWIVMEYVAGETLDAAIRRFPTGMPVEMIRTWLPGAVAGIGFLHSRGLVHRDLKPANLFIENGVVKVGDVGLSKFIAPSRQSAHTQSVGTVYYMAPEVAQGRYGKEVDIYALGVILYEMLTGELPFDGESTGEILMKHLMEKPDLSRLPPRLQPVVARALEKDPRHRYATMEELLQAFQNAVSGRTETKPTALDPVMVNATSTVDRQRCGHRPGGSRAVHSAASSKRRRRKCSNFGGYLGHLFWIVPVCLATLSHLDIDLLENVPPWMKSITDEAWTWSDKDRSWFMRWVAMMSIAVPVAFFVRRSQLRIRSEQTSDLPPAIVPASRSTRIFRSADAPAVAAPHQVRPMIGAACAASLLIVPYTVLLSILLAFLRPSQFSISTTHEIDPGLLGFFIGVSILASWGVIWLRAFSIRPSKQRSFRGQAALMGALVGLAAWKLDQYLLVDLSSTENPRFNAIFGQLGEHHLSTTVGPTLAGYCVFFVTLFVLRNWQKLTSPLRPQRFSVGTVFITVLTAWLATKVFEFPTIWALSWSVVIACGVQLACHWDDGPRPRFTDHS